MIKKRLESQKNKPLFYQNPMVLRDTEHRGFGLTVENGRYQFAAEAPAVPVVASEFGLIARHYPIVFSLDEVPVPLAVMGCSPGSNTYVDQAGEWAPGVYIPGYIRRYPFIGITDGGEGPIMLGVDSSCRRLTAHAERDGAVPFFDAEGTPTPKTMEALGLCEAYAREHDAICLFTAALLENGLLSERALTIQSKQDSEHAPAPADRRVQISGFRLIDEAAFRSLKQEIVYDFHIKGWLDLIVLHFSSQLAWQDIVERASTLSAVDVNV